jgi:lipopolysaccharide export system protein LptA
MCVWTLTRLSNIVILTGLLCTASALAQEQRATPDERTTITAKMMTVRNQENKAIFEGAVVLTRGPLVVHSDKMVMHYQGKPDAETSPGAQTASCGSGETASRGKPAVGRDHKTNAGQAMPTVSDRKVCLIEASGNVTIEKDEGRAICRKAVFYQEEEKIVLTGDPVVWQRGTRVSGQKITMFLAEDRSVVEGGSQVTIVPEGERRSP